MIARIATLAALVLGCSMQHEMEPRPQDPSFGAVAVPRAEGAPPGLYVPSRAGDQIKLAEWRATVGPAIIETVPSSRFAAVPFTDTLIVLTWNSHGGAGDPLALLESELELACGSDLSVARGFKHFVLLFQETFRRSHDVPRAERSSVVPAPLSEKPRPGERIDVVELAQRCGLALVYVPSMRNGDEEYEDGREDRGNAILSTLPLSDPIAIELPFEAQRRVALAATVRRPAGDSLRAVNVHLDVASSLLRVLHTGNSTRQRQGLGLLDALSDIEAARGESLGISTVAAGDFNTWSARETVMQHLYRAFPESPTWDGLPTRGDFPTDFILFRESERGGVRYVDGSERRLEDRHGSDHHARMARFSFAR